MSEYNLFCFAKEFNDNDSFQQKRYRVFNKEVDKKRYFEILNTVKEIFKNLKLELNKNSWIKEWQKVKTENWLELSKIPEFDQKVVEDIIGFKLKIGKKKSRPKLNLQIKIERLAKELADLKAEFGQEKGETK